MPPFAQNILSHPSLNHPISNKIKQWLSFDPLYEIILRVSIVGFGLLLIASSIFYGIAVYLESQTMTEGKSAWQIQEENLNLQAELNQLQAYESVSQMTTKLTGLKPAKTPLTINLNLKAIENQAKTPETPMPKAPYSYGYGY
jgi:hypothetical protein